jgi:hypothetical protein
VFDQWGHHVQHSRINLDNNAVFRLAFGMCCEGMKEEGKIIEAFWLVDLQTLVSPAW